MTFQTISLFLLGAAASMAGNMIGFGGGIFVIPILVIVFKVPMSMAVGSITISVLLAATISTLFNLRSRSVDMKVAIAMEIPTIMGAIIGAKLTAFLPLKTLEVLFSFFITIIGLKMLKTSRLKFDERISWSDRLNNCPPLIHSSRGRVISIWVAGIFGGIAGLVAGLFGIGGGFLKTPVMIRVVKLPIQIAVSTSLFMIVFTSVTSSVSHFYLGHIDFHITLPLAIGFASGALVAQRFRKISDSTVEKLVGIGLLAASLSVLIDALVLK
ncbi:MAG: sulfite exporter TauE/SafE family protein [Bdellovibrio sp.]|nr:sulfite exporter TauE/SafE family protein [Bdellovibrio sp.]